MVTTTHLADTRDKSCIFCTVTPVSFNRN